MKLYDNPVYINSDAFQKEICAAIDRKQLPVQYHKVIHSALVIEATRDYYQALRAAFPEAELLLAKCVAFESASALVFSFSDAYRFFGHFSCKSTLSLLRAATNARECFTFFEPSDENTFTIILMPKVVVTFPAEYEYEVIDLNRIRLCRNGQMISAQEAIAVDPRPEQYSRFVLENRRLIAQFSEFRHLQKYFARFITFASSFRLLIREECFVEDFYAQGNELYDAAGNFYDEPRISINESMHSDFAIATAVAGEGVLRRQLREIQVDPEISQYCMKQPLVQIEPCLESLIDLVQPPIQEDDMLHYFKTLKMNRMSVVLLRNVDISQLPSALRTYKHHQSGQDSLFLVPEADVCKFYVHDILDRHGAEVVFI